SVDQSEARQPPHQFRVRVFAFLLARLNSSRKVTRQKRSIRQTGEFLSLLSFSRPQGDQRRDRQPQKSFHQKEQKTPEKKKHPTLKRKRRKTEIAKHGHLENLDVTEIRHRVSPFRRRPVIPELPKKSADKTTGKQREQAAPIAARKIPHDRF